MELLLEGVETCGGGGTLEGVEFTDEASSMLVNEIAFEWTEWNVETVGVARSYTVEREREIQFHRGLLCDKMRQAAPQNKPSGWNYDVIMFTFF